MRSSLHLSSSIRGKKNSILNSVHLLPQRAVGFTVQQLASLWSSEHNCDLPEVNISRTSGCCLTGMFESTLHTPWCSHCSTSPHGSKAQLSECSPQHESRELARHFHPSKLTLSVHSEQLLPNPIAVG